MLSTLKTKHGMPEGAIIIGMGHSLGGASLQAYSAVNGTGLVRK